VALHVAGGDAMERTRDVEQPDWAEQNAAAFPL
jgi:hypothetical protein